jgi:hypothetical protein
MALSKFATRDVVGGAQSFGSAGIVLHHCNIDGLGAIGYCARIA